MGKTIKRFDRDDEYHDVESARKKSVRRHEQRAHSREINDEDETEAYVPPSKYKKPSYKGK